MVSTHNWKRTIVGRASVLYSNAKSRCKKKKIGLHITHEWIQKHLERGTCELTGLPFSLEPPPPGLTRRLDAPSLDRISKHKPYTEENTRVILWAVNCALSEYGTSTMLPILKAMIKGIEDVNQGSTTPVPDGLGNQSTNNPQLGTIPTTGIGQDSNDTDDDSGSVRRLNFNHSAQESSGNRLGRRNN